MIWNQKLPPIAERDPYDILSEMTKDSGSNRSNSAEKVGPRPPLDAEKSSSSSKPFHGLSVTSAIPYVAGFTMKAFLGATVVLYILNQKHALPRPLSAFVSRTLFWPTLPITVSRRIGRWTTRIDDTVVMGGAPFGFLDYPETLHDKYGVRIINPSFSMFLQLGKSRYALVVPNGSHVSRCSVLLKGSRCRQSLRRIQGTGEKV